jgi:spermidine synthase
LFGPSFCRFGNLRSGFSVGFLIGIFGLGLGVVVPSFKAVRFAVKKRTILETHSTPDGRTLTLEEHDTAYTIRMNGIELMSTRQHASEEKLAEVGCRDLKSRRNAQVLIGGLGLGFTLKAALTELGADARIQVVELFACVGQWNLDPRFPLARLALADPRVKLRIGDVAVTLQRSQNAFDAILMDVDNGAHALSAPGNARLYSDAGLASFRQALRPGGRVVFWSAAEDPTFAKRVAHAGLNLEVIATQSRPHSGSRHTLYIGNKAGQRTRKGV